MSVVNHFFKANKIEEAQKKDIFLAAVGLETYELLCSLVAPSEPDGKSFDELVKAVENHLNPPPSKIMARFKFYTLIRDGSESVSNFVVRLRRAAQDCKFADINEHLRDRFIVGISDKVIQTKLLSLTDDISFNDALQHALALETAAQNAQSIQAAASTDSTTTDVNKVSVAPGSCYSCGSEEHFRRQCKFRNAQCHACNRKGHISKVCQSRNERPKDTSFPSKRGRHIKETTSRQRANIVQRTSEVDEPDDSSGERSEAECCTVTVFNVGKERDIPIEVKVKIQSQDITMQLDTGAAISLMSKDTFEKKLGHLPLKQSKLRLSTYTGEDISVLGCAEVNVTHKNQEAKLPLIIVDGDGPSLLGRNWLAHLQIDWAKICSIQQGSIKSLLARYTEVFQEGLGKYKGPPVKLFVEPGSRPRFFKARPVPYSIREKVKEAIDNNVQLGIWEPVDYSDWAAPVVPVLKDDDTIRLCGDYKVTINQFCKVDTYPLPRIEDIFAILQGGQKFSKIDLHSAYSQIPVDEESQQYLTVNTHMGLFKVKRLPFGVNAAVGIFQRIISNVLQGLSGVCVYLDDILITGKDEDEHLHNIELVLERLKKAGLQAKRSKCSFLKSSVVYLGHRIDDKGLHPTDEKVRAIKEAPEPSNRAQLRSFLGLINYYGKFLPNISSTLFPLYQLVGKKATWTWGNTEKMAFKRAQDMLSASRLLVHYDPQLPLLLECDASGHGVGAVLSHRFPDGRECPIAYASRSLNSAERNYAQIDREALSLVFGVQRFHQYLYGRKFTLVTDHKPLTYLFGMDSAIPNMASPRIQRWALKLSGYAYCILYKKGKDNSNADALSRLPLPETPSIASAPRELVLVVDMLDSEKIVNADVIRLETRRDPVLSQLLHWVRWGWPDRDPGGEYSPYFIRRNELSLMDGSLLWGSRVIIPKISREAVLGLLHDTHIGITRMKATSRSYIWWPGLDGDIESTVKHCRECDRDQKAPAVAELSPWEWPSNPWSRIHVDHAGPFMGQLFLIVIDSHSKWMEVVPVSNTSTSNTCDALNNIFSTHGLPVTLVSDNGTAFTSHEFSRWCQRSGIKHIRSAPRHPSTNGLAERAVQIFKNCIKKMDTSLSWTARIYKFLFRYRNTPHSTTGETPSLLLMNRVIRTHISLL